MLKFRQALSPDLFKLFEGKFSVPKKRSALWFFRDDMLKKWAKEAERDNCWLRRQPGTSSTASKKLRRADILDIWNRMNPESKRKYYTMSAMDEVRYHEQKSLLISEITTHLKKHGSEVENLDELTSEIDLEEAEGVQIEKYQKNCERMIQTETTKQIYKDFIKRVKKDLASIDIPTTDQLISTVPEDYRSILKRPKRPATPFVLYASDEARRENFTNLRKELYPNLSYFGVASLHWKKEDQSVRDIYAAKYDLLMEEYNEEVKKFNEEPDNYFEKALKEKRLFKKSLRKRMREHVPLSVRNAFNFFAMDNKGACLTEINRLWKLLPDEEKVKYHQMVQDDSVRYRVEKDAFESLVGNFDKIGLSKNSTASNLDNKFVDKC